jgi:hypothetical protein
MLKKLLISAETIGRLRNFLDDADLDLGCRPHARERQGRIETVVLSSEDEFQRLVARRSAGIEIEDLGDLPEPETRSRMMRPGNRFGQDAVPRGLGVKE